VTGEYILEPVLFDMLDKDTFGSLSEVAFIRYFDKTWHDKGIG
jgi:hypothetical protein